jgi:N6-adenosine-specific RNA methylase IME4
MLRNTFAELEALATTGYRAGVIYVDAPHSFSTYSAKGRDRCADKHYAVMNHADILAMAPLVQALAAPDCALFNWASGTFDERSREMMLAWGFRLINFAFIWVKTKKGCAITEPDELSEIDLTTGTGLTTRANAEFVRLGKRGSLPRLNNDVHQIIIAPRGAHSAKPEAVAHRIERPWAAP